MVRTKDVLVILRLWFNNFTLSSFKALGMHLSTGG